MTAFRWWPVSNSGVKVSDPDLNVRSWGFTGAIGGLATRRRLPLAFGDAQSKKIFSFRSKVYAQLPEALRKRRAILKTI